jgi:hypothetical protein
LILRNALLDCLNLQNHPRVIFSREKLGFLLFEFDKLRNIVAAKKFEENLSDQDKLWIFDGEKPPELPFSKILLFSSPQHDIINQSQKRGTTFVVVVLFFLFLVTFHCFKQVLHATLVIERVEAMQ